MLAAMDVLTAMPRREYQPQIFRAMASSHSRLRLHALQALHVGGQPITDAPTMEALRDLYRKEGEWPLREACVKASGLLPPQQRVVLLIEALDDPLPQVQKLAVELLTRQEAGWVMATLLQAVRSWQLGIRGQIAALSVLTETVSHEQLRELALEYLKQAVVYHAWLPALGTPTPATELLAISLRERVAQLGDLGLRALAPGPNRNLVEVLRAAMASDNRRQRMLCLELIEDFPDREAGLQLRQLLQPPPSTPQRAIAPLAAELSCSADRWVAQCAQQWEPA
jgi:HEAT repeat protein